YSVDTRTGTVLTSPILTPTVESLEFDPIAGALFGLAHSGDGLALVAIDPATGTQTLVGTLPSGVRVNSRASTIDPQHHRYICHRHTFRAGRPSRLYAVDTRTGAVLTSPLLTPTVESLEFDPIAGALVGLAHNGNGLALVAIDPTTGTQTLVATLPSG